MATLDEVISQMSEEDYYNDPIQFVIDSDLRVISIPGKGVVAGVVGDKNINRINFQMSRYYNGFDMSKFTTRVNYINARGNFNYYSVTDLTIEDDLIYFTWLVDSDVVEYAGIVMFAVNMFITDSNGKIIQSFNTSNKGLLNVLEGIQVNEYVTPEEQEDILTRLEADLTKYISSGINQIQDEVSKVKKSLPADYAKMTEDVTSLKEDLGQLFEEKVDKTELTLGVHTDGLIYIFVDGKPVGKGFNLSSKEDVARFVSWIDEFDQNVLNTDNWMYRTWGDSWSLVTGQPQFSEGIMDIPLVYDTETNRWKETMLLTNGLQEVKYGRLEARMKFDKNCNVAFWTVGQTFTQYNGESEGIIWPYSGEIDIFESTTGESVFSTIHYGNCEGGSESHETIRVGSIDVDCTQWHIYALEWNENVMFFYVDNTLIGSIDTTDIVYENGFAPFKNPHYMILNITHGANADTSKTYHCYVDYVKYYPLDGVKENVEIEKMQLSESVIELNANRTKEIELDITPSYVTDYTLKWESSDREIATFSGGNRIVTKKNGTVELSVTAKNGVKATSQLIVSNDVLVPTTRIELDFVKAESYLMGESLEINAIVYPKYATNLDVNWESSNTNIATVNNGIVNFVGDGNVTIKAIAKDNESIFAEVTLVSKSNIVDNIPTDGCVTKLTRKGFGDTQWSNDLDTGIDITVPSTFTDGFEYVQSKGYRGYYATKFDGRMNAGVDLFDIDGPFTICTRVLYESGVTFGGGNIMIVCTNASDTNNGKIDIGKGTSYIRDVSGNQVVRSLIVPTVDNSQIDVSQNIVVIKDENKVMYLYVNGELIASDDGFSSKEDMNLTDMYFGVGSSKVTNLIYQSLIAYNKAMTETEVLALNTALDEMYA